MNPTLPTSETYDVRERDPDFIAWALPLLRFYTGTWHRAEVRGLEHLAEVPAALLVGNHSGGFIPPDAPVIGVALWERYGLERSLFLLAHDALFQAPGAEALRRCGIMPARRANAHHALTNGGLVLVFPGGDWDVTRPTCEQGQVQLAGRKGFIDTALDANVPIVPIVSLGAQETQWFLSRGDWLVSWLPMARAFRLGVLPISVGWPFGLSVGGFPPNLPLPAKIVTQILPPIHLRAQFGATPDRDQVYAHVLGTMQVALDELTAERRLPVLG